MLSLALGLVAALAWGTHDLCVRYVSQRAGILPTLTAVLLCGTLILTPLSASLGNWPALTKTAASFSLLSGMLYLVACIGLYKAFSIGPVRLVAPIVGAYPILSVVWAFYRGQPVLWDQWLAVSCVILGVALVGYLCKSETPQKSQTAAILWASLGATGFACAFATGHIATQSGDPLPVILLTRAAATLGAALLLLGQSGPKRPPRATWPFIGAMALLDTTAHSVVLAAGTLPRPEFAAVAASMFGMVTVILAWAVLREHMSRGQWAGVALAFCAIGYLAL